MSAADAVRLVYENLKGWAYAFLLKVPNILLAVLIVVVASLASRRIGKLFGRVLRRVAHNELINSLVSKIVTLSTFLLGLLIALSILGLDKTVTSLLAGVGVIGIALGFAFQDIASNFMAGIMISLQRPCDVGDLVRTGNFTGRVEKISLRATTIRTFQGPLVIIPNKDIIQGALTNFTRTAERRVELRVGVSYDDDLEKVREKAIEAVSPITSRKTDREIEVYFEEFDDSSINLVLWMWVDYHNERDFVAARSEAIMRIKAAFERAHITIPFPIRTLDFAAKGATTVREALSLVTMEDTYDPRSRWKGSGKAASEGAGEDTGADEGDTAEGGEGTPKDEDQG
jgi:small conductance mechanosensitive channel